MKNGKFIFTCIFFGICHPFVAVLAYFICITLGLTSKVSTNVDQFSPIYAVLAAFLFWFFAEAKFRLTIKLKRFKNLQIEEFWNIIRWSQIPYLPFIIGVIWLLIGIEGNIVGYILVPAYLVLGPITFIISNVLYFWLLRRRMKVVTLEVD